MCKLSRYLLHDVGITKSVKYHYGTDKANYYIWRGPSYMKPYDSTFNRTLYR